VQQRVPSATVAALVALVVAGCSAGGAPAPTSPGASATPSPPPTSTAPSPTPTVVTREVVEDQGTAVRAGDARVRVLPAPGTDLDVERRDDGSVVVELDGPAWLAGAGARVLADGSALAGGGGVQPDGPRLAAAGDDVLRIDGPGSLWFAGTAVERVDWGDREGGRSLAVTPSAWAREGTDAARELIRDQLVAAEPEAGSATMLDQLRCHEIGAPDKATWNLEPWRPDVGLSGMIRALCNPE